MLLLISLYNTRTLLHRIQCVADYIFWRIFYQVILYHWCCHHHHLYVYYQPLIIIYNWLLFTYRLVKKNPYRTILFFVFFHLISQNVVSDIYSILPFHKSVNHIKAQFYESSHPYGLLHPSSFWFIFAPLLHITKSIQINVKNIFVECLSWTNPWEGKFDKALHLIVLWYLSNFLDVYYGVIADLENFVLCPLLQNH